MKAQSSLEAKAAATALKLAARKAWLDITLEQIAKASKTPLPHLKKLFPAADSLLPAIVGLIDAETKKNAGTINRKDSPHDRLFETMMARFDSLQAHRSGIKSIAGACRQKPEMALRLLQAQVTSMNFMLRLAHLEKNGAIGLLQMTGLMAIYHLALHRWLSDDTPDMAKTMSFIDHALRKSANVMKYLSIED